MVTETAAIGASATVEALELFVEVLSQSDAATAGPADQSRAGDAFFNRLCEAVCRLARMRRAVIFHYDDGRRRVRAAGAHRLDLRQFADVHVTVESSPLAAAALSADRVIEASGEVSDQFPPEFADLFPDPVRLVCAPMAAAGRGIGVIFADRLLSAPPLDEGERDLLWSLGKAAALASVARRVTAQSERARQLEQRIDLAREIHEGVMQRLFGVSMALDGDGDLPAAARARCASETQSALADLRNALQRPLGRAPKATQTTLFAEVGRLARQHPELELTLASGADGDVPPALEPLAQSVLAEAVRNAYKHARPTRVSVRVGRRKHAFVLEVTNDGVSPSGTVRGRPRRAGIGLRLSALEAVQSGGVLEFGELEPSSWRLCLVVPVQEQSRRTYGPADGRPAQP